MHQNLESKRPPELKNLLRGLFVARSKEELTQTLPHASALAVSLRAEMVVLSVFPADQDAPSVTFKKGRQLYDVHGLQHREARIESGEFLSILAKIVESNRFSLVIVPPMEGHAVTRMVHHLQVPVLVARHGAPQKVFAAVSHREQQLSIFARANQMSRRLRASLVLVHNVAPRVWIKDEEVSARRERLTEMSRGVPPGTKVLVLQEPDPVSALLSCASSKEDTLVIVGAQPRWPEHHNDFDVAARLVEKAPGDVLVTPLSS